MDVLRVLAYPFTTPADFTGQQQAERTYQVMIVVATVIGFFHGYAMDNFQYTVLWWGAASGLAALLTIPVWPLWARHPVAWREEKPAAAAAAAGTKKRN
jgi:hypothetical protein